jgi:hypothetical protein
MSSAIATSTTIRVNPLWIAVIAVLGTVVGATISALTQVLTTRRSSVSQLTAIKLQLNHETQEAIRQERRQVYARFLVVRHKWTSMTSDICEAVQKKQDPLSTEALSEEYRTAYAELDLLATERLAEWADQVYWKDLQAMWRAHAGDQPYRTLEPEGGRAVMELERAMRDELGIGGTRPFDPVTGLRPFTPLDK